MSFGFDYDGEIFPERSLHDDAVSPHTLRQSLSFRRAILGLSDPTAERLEARLCSLVADGTPLGEHRVRRRSGDDGDPHYEKRFGELIDLGRVLVGSGLDARVASIESLSEPLPDFRLRLADGTTAYAEVGRVLVPSAAALSNGATALRRGIRRRTNRNRRFELSLGGSATTLTLARPLGRRIAEAVDETENLLRLIAGDADAGPRAVDEMRFPVLHSVGATCDVVRHRWRIYAFDIEVAPPPWDPAETRTAFRKLHAQKAVKRNGYPVKDPVWLVMPLADEFQTTSAVLGALRDIAPFEARPYELLVVGAIEDAIVVE
ncbi:MAG TPA: hypothetical protein VGX96_20875 [Candidatus Elarobacter sp.]|nr:hypothetical protein [Candidatus Elarobacter sp.]